jgi:hypothetical protein
MQKIVTCSSSFLLRVGETSCYNLFFSGSFSLVVSHMQLIVVVLAVDSQGRAGCIAYVGGFLTFMSIGGFPSFIEDMKVQNT